MGSPDKSGHLQKSFKEKSDAGLDYKQKIPLEGNFVAKLGGSERSWELPRGNLKRRGWSAVSSVRCRNALRICSPERGRGHRRRKN